MKVPAAKTPESGPLARAVSEEVRVAMTRRRITAKQLAERAGMSANYLGKRLRDEAPLNSNDIEAICEALGEDLWDFLRATVDAAERTYPKRK